MSVDAKSGIQALDRTQPLGPIDFGKTQKRTFDYARMGTTDLYAAMDVRTGKVITSLAQTHATPDFLRLMKNSTFAVMLRRGPRLAGLPGFLRLWLVGGMWGEIGLR